MILNTKTPHAVRIMIDLAQQGERVRLKDVAERLGISAKYIEPIVAELRQAGLVGSKRGVHGGYLLGRPARKITIGEIVRAVDDAYVASEDWQDGPAESVIEEVRRAMFKAMDRMTLAKVIKGKR